MSPEAPGFVVPSDEILSILKVADLPVDTQPTPLDNELLDKFVAVATVYEESGNLHNISPAHIGRVAAIGDGTGHAHLDWRHALLNGRLEPTTNVTLIVPETFHTETARDPEFPNFTKIVAVRSLFYVLPRGKLY